MKHASESRPMRSSRRIAAVLLIGTALIGLPVAGSLVLPSEAATPVEQTPAEQTPVEQVPAGQPAGSATAQAAPVETPMMNAPATFSGIVKAVAPAVVNVSVVAAAEVAGGGVPEMPQFPPGSPFADMFRRFFEGQPGAPRRAEPVRAVGSGFIIDPEGYVVTNNHVVEKANEIMVTLDDGRQYEAEIVGRDTKTDLALLKIEADEPLPFVEWGDSDAVEVGDWVVAVGNPFGLGGTVTTGIVSARGRNLQSGPFDDFLQIDAAINRGNSGGPTFDLEGHVIGINTAIFSPSGGSVGIGFAIPSNMARDVIGQLQETGTVARGWIGVQVQTVTEAMAEALGLDEARGALVAGTLEDGPAAAAGLAQGDVILSFDGKPIDSMIALPRIVAATKSGETVPVEVLRDGARKTIEVTVGDMPGEEQVASADPRTATGALDGNAAVESALGLAVAPLSPEIRERFGIVDETGGVLVTGVREDGPARGTGVGPGDIILRIGSSEVRSVEDIVTGIEQARRDDRSAVMLLVGRQGNERFVAVPLNDA